MSHIIRTRALTGDVAVPDLHVFLPDSDGDEDRDIVFDIYSPGTYRLRIWTESEWSLLPAHARPGDAFEHAGLHFVIDEPA